MVTSCIAHTAPEAADSGFLWLSVSRWERGTNTLTLRQRGRRRKLSVGFSPVFHSLGSSPNPLQVQPNKAEEIH